MARIRDRWGQFIAFRVRFTVATLLDSPTFSAQYSFRLLVRFLARFRDCASTASDVHLFALSSSAHTFSCVQKY